MPGCSPDCYLVDDRPKLSSSRSVLALSFAAIIQLLQGLLWLKLYLKVIWTTFLTPAQQILHSLLPQCSDLLVARLTQLIKYHQSLNHGYKTDSMFEYYLVLNDLQYKFRKILSDANIRVEPDISLILTLQHFSTSFSLQGLWLPSKHYLTCAAEKVAWHDFSPFCLSA